MKKLAVVIGIIFGFADAWAHNHPAPKSCEEWCEDSRCKCYDKCGPTYLERTSGCTDACNKTKENCSNKCSIPHPT